jgi:hypothetical protein
MSPRARSEVRGAASTARATTARAETAEPDEDTNYATSPNLGTPSAREAGDAPDDARGTGAAATGAGASGSQRVSDARDAASHSQRTRDARDVGGGARTATDVAAKRLYYRDEVVDAAETVLRGLAKKPVPEKMQKALIEKHIGKTMAIMLRMSDYSDRQHLFTGDVAREKLLSKLCARLDEDSLVGRGRGAGQATAASTARKKRAAELAAKRTLRHLQKVLRENVENERARKKLDDL